MNNSFAKKCRDNNIDCSKAYKFRAKHSDLTDEQIIEYYRNKKTIDYASIRLGERNISLNGLEMELVKYINSHDIDVQFEDGGTFNNEKIFLCTCKTCKGKHVLKLSEMKDFECTRGNHTK